MNPDHPREVLIDAAGGILTITIDRPQQRNAMSLTAATEIAEALALLDSEDDLSAAILTGSGGTFCAGMDLKRFQLGERPVVPGRGFGGLVEAPPAKPLIAAVEGWALGGGFEMVLACDLVVAGTSAKFGLPEVKRGLAARAGGIFRAPRALPRAVALEMLLTGEPIGAAEAQQHGLVNRVVDDGSALSAARNLAEAISVNAPLAVRASKALALDSRTWSDAESFDRQNAYTDPVFASEDAKEGAAAFTQRRPPVWRGR